MYFLFIHANKLIIHFLSVTGTIFWLNLNLKGFYLTMIKSKVPLQGYIKQIFQETPIKGLKFRSYKGHLYK